MRRQLGLPERIRAWIILGALSAVLILPFLFMVSISLSTDKTVAENAFTVLPREFRWENYLLVIGDPTILGYVWNSVLLCAGAILGQVLVSAFVAFGFARFRAREKGLVFMILLGTMMIPGEVTMIPQFLLFRSLGWLDSILPLVVPNFFGGAFNIFLLRQVMMTIPLSYDEAALMEGAGHLWLWRRVILPLVQPTLVAVAIFTFSWNWGWFSGPLIYITSLERYPLALGTYFMTATSNVGAIPPWNSIMVTSMLLTLPMILVYGLGQRYVYAVNIGSNDLLK